MVLSFNIYLFIDYILLSYIYINIYINIYIYIYYLLLINLSLTYNMMYFLRYLWLLWICKIFFHFPIYGFMFTILFSDNILKINACDCCGKYAKVLSLSRWYIMYIFYWKYVLFVCNRWHFIYLSLVILSDNCGSYGYWLGISGVVWLKSASELSSLSVNKLYGSNTEECIGISLIEIELIICLYMSYCVRSSARPTVRPQDVYWLDFRIGTIK